MDTKKEEGFSSKEYKDTTNHDTIGYGFNINDKTVRPLLPKDVLSGKRELTKDEADIIYHKLYSRAINDAKQFLGNSYGTLSVKQKNAINDMSYNLGLTRLSKFKKMKRAIENKDFDKAAVEIENSKYYKQVPNRAKRNMRGIRDIGSKKKILNALK